MAPNATSPSTTPIPVAERFTTPLEYQIEKRNREQTEYPKEDEKIPSTYPGIWKYPTNRDTTFRLPDDWLRSKSKDDNIEGLWRVHDKIYDLEPFVKNHPGGPEWIKMSRGTDITEMFYASHVINFSLVEKVLAKYYVKDATTQRISPYTLKEDGFYMTLKRRVEPILQKVGTQPTRKMLLMEDSLLVTFLTFALLAVLYDSIVLALISGLFLSFSTIGAHNFLHLKENWRRYYFDLSLLNSYEYRITHAFSHHMYPNTLMDFELGVFPTFQFLPNRPKPWYQRHFSVFYSHITYSAAFWIEFIRRAYHISKGVEKFRVENLLPLVELAGLIAIQGDPWVALRTWAVIHTMCSFSMNTIGATASHHHLTCFHDGDEPLQDPDFGIGQLDATKDRAENLFNHSLVTLITFGHHPLHHLFPTVCHSKLHHLKKVFEETAIEFRLDYPGIPQMEMYFHCYQQLARTVPFNRKKADEQKT